MADMPRPSMNRDQRIYWMSMLQLRHVPASMRGLLYMRSVGVMGWMGGTGMGRFRKGSGGQTND